ncbi:MAG TPA: DUF2339 domain-containing protein [Methylobacterium sp.]|jgi:uncharacterized membrane protein|uniref:DUF2339 domain-containing protein n=1 Tax=Methylorubrum sp. B1-46 TaxID=2897334 RepID=UPI001E314ED6|nr:DUF2339 domain-containing protein [Methylorubrum sp. B1-46]UGB25420.1 DUF2339 domain-containing protein [Methylorubrum sp. B1-46]HEV2543908.1 DUF2339 domain-containing protein [Methylobacterium sp.]
MDDGLFLSAVLIALALALSCPAALLLALRQRHRIQVLERRLALVEARPIAGPAPIPAAAPAAAPEPRDVRPPEPPPELATPRSAVPAVTPGQPVSASSPALPPDRSPAPSIEERFGTRWTVWVGGLALAFGAVLLVRYSAERGLFGPGVRIVGGFALAFGLVGLGEVLRRRLRGAASVPPAWPDVPAMVTAAGTVGLFGAVYAAHALYGFIGPGLAFAGLAVTGLAAMFAALLHGPALAGIGLVGALATPLLVGGGGTSLWPLALYLPVVAGSAYAFAWAKGWRALAVAAGLGAAAWALFLTLLPGQSLAVQAHLVLQQALAVLVFAVLPGRGVPDAQARLDRFAALALALAGGVALAVLGLTATDGGPGWAGAALAATVLPALAGLVAAPAAAGSAVAALTLAGALMLWPQASDPAVTPFFLLWYGAANPGLLIALAVAGSLAVAAIGALRLLGGSGLPYATALTFAAGAAAAPLAALVLVYLRIAGGAVAPGFAAAAGVLAAGFCSLAALCRRQGDQTPSPALALGLGAFAAAAVASLCLGLVFALSGGSLTPALAGAALATGLIARRLDIPALRWCVAGLAALVAARLAWDPALIGADLSRTPILNGLVTAYGLPALCFGLAAWVIRRPGRPADIPEQVAQALSLLLSGLFVFLEIRHALHGGDLSAPGTSVLEQGLTTLTALGFSGVLTWFSGPSPSPVIRFGGLAFACLALLQGALGLGLAANPLLTDEPVAGGLVLNDAVLAYALPAAASFALARAARDVRPVWFVRMAGGLGLALSFLALCLAVRHGFQGERLGLDRETGQAEWYTYSAAWLALGLIALGYGILRGSATARLASAVLVGLATLKVFLLDLSGLEGPLRALSFLGLGGCLIAIGLVYQRLVFAPPPPLMPPSAAPEA